MKNNYYIKSIITTKKKLIMASALLIIILISLSITSYAEETDIITGREAIEILLEHHGISIDEINIEMISTALGIKSIDDKLNREFALVAIIRSYGFYPVMEVDHEWNDEYLQEYNNRAYIDYAYRMGITTGTGDNNFSPDSFITRNDFKAMLNKTEEINPIPIYDIEYDSKLCKLTSAEMQYEISILPDYIVKNYYDEGWKIIATTNPINFGNTVRNEKYIGFILYKEKKILVSTYKQNSYFNIEGVIIHEFGHYISYKTSLISRYSVKEELKWLMFTKGEYCDTNDDEYFAEAFVRYIKQPILIRLKMPITYDHITKCLELLKY